MYPRKIVSRRRFHFTNNAYTLVRMLEVCMYANVEWFPSPLVLLSIDPSFNNRVRAVVRQLLQYRGRFRVGNARSVAHGVPEPGMEHSFLLLHQGAARFFFRAWLGGGGG